MKKITIDLWDADAIVLFDWLNNTRLEDVREVLVTKAQKQALTDLFNELEQTDITNITQKDIDLAMIEVSKDMGWS